MVHGGLKLYWLRFQYNKMAVWVFIYKTVFSNTVASYIGFFIGRLLGVMYWKLALPIHVKGKRLDT